MRGTRRREPDRGGQLGVAGVAEQPVGRDHDRGVLRRHAEMLEQCLGARVGLQVQPAVWEPVARREVAEPPGVRRVPRSDDPQADSEPDQDGAADEVGAQDEIPEPGIAGHQLPEALDRHREHFARVDRHSGEVGSLARQQAELAEEAVAAVHGDGALLRRPARFDEGHIPGENHEKIAVPLAFPEQDLLRLGRTPLAQGSQRGDLGITQPGIGPLRVGGLHAASLPRRQPGRTSSGRLVPGAAAGGELRST